MSHPYASSEYAHAFDAQGFTPTYLEQTQIFVLKRPIPGTPYFDAMGCYPLSPLAKTGNFENDFAQLKDAGIVSLVLVTDPFFHPELAALQTSFDHVLAYKEHYLNDFSHAKLYESDNHHYKVRRALKSCEVKQISLVEHLEAWCALYDMVIGKHQVGGIQAFSRPYFEALAKMDNVTVGAFIDGQLVSCQINLGYEGYAYSHLVASNDLGYSSRAAYAVYDFSLKHFAKTGAKFFDLGSGAGINTASDGLTMFKKGFSTATQMCYLCGKIIDAELYRQLNADKNGAFFPLYRSPN